MANTHLWAGMADRLQNQRRAVPVLDISGVNDQPEQQSDGVDDGMTFSTLDLLPFRHGSRPNPGTSPCDDLPGNEWRLSMAHRIPQSYRFRWFSCSDCRLSALCCANVCRPMDNARRRLRIAALQFARDHGQIEADRLPEPAVAPIVEITLDGGSGREVFRQHPPPLGTCCAGPAGQRLDANACSVQHRIHNVAKTGGTWPPQTARFRQERRDELPLIRRAIRPLDGLLILLIQSKRLHIVRCHADTLGERLQFRALVAPFRLQTGQNHKPLKSLNSFWIRL